MTNHIHYSFLVLIGILLLPAITNPVQAFTADTLTIQVLQNGDAEITFDYTMTFMERFAVFLKIANPGAELKKAMESNFHKQVTILELTDTSTKFTVQGLATRKQNKGKTLLSTPAVSFDKADRYLKRYWFADLVNPDFSPRITTIIYPDGYKKEFFDKTTIPKTSHTI